MAKVLLVMFDDNNGNYEITEHVRDHRLGIEYVFDNDNFINVFCELLKHNKEISIDIAFDIFNKLKDHYLQIIDDSKKLLDIDNNLQKETYGKYYDLSFKIFCDMFLFKDKIEINLDNYFKDCGYKIVLHGIKNGSWKYHGVNKIAYFAMKCDVINIDTNEKIDRFTLHVDNAYYCVNPLKDHKWYKKLWAKIKWSFVHFHNFDVKEKFITYKKGV